MKPLIVQRLLLGFGEGNRKHLSQIEPLDTTVQTQFNVSWVKTQVITVQSILSSSNENIALLRSVNPAGKWLVTKNPGD